MSRLVDAGRALNDRKMALLGDQDTGASEVTEDAMRKMVVGLDLDLHEMRRVFNSITKQMVESGVFFTAASTEGEPLLVLTPPVLEAVWSEALMLGALHRDLVEHAA
jgi:hypothetical protein